MGRPAFSSSSTIRTAVSGTFSLGFRTKVLPQASALGNIHSGTIAGKLNGVIPAQTPRGWSEGFTVDAAGEVLERVAEEQGGDAAGVLDVFESPEDAAAGFGEGLAVLAGDALAESVEVLLDQLAVAEEHPRPLHRRGFAPGREGGRGGGDRRADFGGAAGRALGDHLAGRGIVDRACARARRGSIGRR